MIAENYGIRCWVRLHIPISLPLLGSVLFVVSGFEVSVGLLFEIVIVGSHTILRFLSVYEGIRIELLLIVVVLISGR